MKHSFPWLGVVLGILALVAFILPLLLPKPKAVAPYWMVTWGMLGQQGQRIIGTTTVQTTNLMNWYVDQKKCGNDITILWTKEITFEDHKKFGELPGSYNGCIDPSR